MEDISPISSKLDATAKEGIVLDRYAFPDDPPNDLRLGFVAAMYQDAILSDHPTGISGLSEEIKKSGSSTISQKFHRLFAASFAHTPKFPPIIIIHGEDDISVFLNQSSDFEMKLRGLGVKTHLEPVPGVGHGFNVQDGDIDVEKSTVDKPYFEYQRRI